MNAKTKGYPGLMSVVLESQAAWFVLALYTSFSYFEADPRLVGGLALLAAVLFMNSLARSELFFGRLNLGKFHNNPISRLLRFTTDEAELAGIFVALICSLMILIDDRGAEVFGHIPYYQAITLFGIMSAATFAVRQMSQILAYVEKRLGARAALFVGAVLSTFTGEPAAAMFLSEFAKARIANTKAARTATGKGLGVVIGYGGAAFLPFSAPPILIVWAILQGVFGWTIGHLVFFVGIAAMINVWVGLGPFWKCLAGGRRDGVDETDQALQLLPLLYLAVVVLANIFASNHLIVMCLNVATGAASMVYAARQQYPAGDHEAKFQAVWQPLILGVLLIGLEIIGIEAEPLLRWVGSTIPASFPPVLVATILFFAAAWSSHIADNALASRVFISVAAALVASSFPTSGDLFAAAVLLGALFGGFLLIPANLPNFPLSKAFGISAGEWLKDKPGAYYLRGALICLVWLLLLSVIL